MLTCKGQADPPIQRRAGFYLSKSSILTSLVSSDGPTSFCDSGVKKECMSTQRLLYMQIKGVAHVESLWLQHITFVSWVVLPTLQSRTSQQICHGSLQLVEHIDVNCPWIVHDAETDQSVGQKGNSKERSQVSTPSHRRPGSLAMPCPSSRLHSKNQKHRIRISPQKQSKHCRENSCECSAKIVHVELLQPLRIWSLKRRSARSRSRSLRWLKQIQIFWVLTGRWKKKTPLSSCNSSPLTKNLCSHVSGYPCPMPSETKVRYEDSKTL